MGQTTLNDVCAILDNFVADNRRSRDPMLRWFADEMAKTYKRASGVRAGRTLWDSDAVAFRTFRRAEIEAERCRLQDEITNLNKEESRLTAPPPDTGG